MALSLRAYLDQYNQDHQHPVNRALHNVGIPMILASVVVLPFNPLLSLFLFVVGWIVQFVGHAFEGKWPSFFRDPTFLAIGPMWLWRKLTGRGVPAEEPVN
jgi:uncharacterized membrane protein YGL010W